MFQTTNQIYNKKNVFIAIDQHVLRKDRPIPAPPSRYRGGSVKQPPPRHGREIPAEFDHGFLQCYSRVLHIPSGYLT
jgi:hypothetical protein